MQRVSAASSILANSASANLGITTTQSGYLNDALVRVWKQIAPVKTWGAIAGFLGLTERAAKHRVAGTRPFTTDELAALLRSEDGLAFLAAVMADSEPRWWRILKGQIKAADYRRRQAQLQKELEETMHAVGQAALLLQDEDFYGSHLGAARAAGRALDVRNRK